MRRRDVLRLRGQEGRGRRSAARRRGALQCHMREEVMRRRDFFSLMCGGMVAMSGIARAQPGGKIPRIGYLWHAGSAKEESPYFEALLDGFARLGYADGRNIKLEHRFPNETPEHFKSMAAELV